MSTVTESEKLTVKRFSVVDEITVDSDEYAEDAGDEFSRPDTYTNHNILGIRECKFGDLVTELDLKVGDEAYLLYYIYSTGDSFGHDGGKYLVPVHLFDSREKAEVAGQVIWNHDKNNNINGPNEPSRAFVYIGNDGSVRSESADWIGYFESLDAVYVERVRVLK